MLVNTSIMKQHFSPGKFDTSSNGHNLQLSILLAPPMKFHSRSQSKSGKVNLWVEIVLGIFPPTRQSQMKHDSFGSKKGKVLTVISILMSLGNPLAARHRPSINIRALGFPETTIMETPWFDNLHLIHLFAVSVIIVMFDCFQFITSDSINSNNQVPNKLFSPRKLFNYHKPWYSTK